MDPIIPLVFGVAFLAVSLARSLWLKRTTGINAYVIDHADPTHRFVAQIFGVVIFGLFAYFGAIVLMPSAEQALGLLSWAVSDVTRLGSILLMGFGIVWTGYAQISMGSSWRIGIPSEAPPLRTNGPFALSRNPIFLGMLAFVLGMTVWSPSAVTMTLLAASYISIEIQIRSEEAFLERMHGDLYRQYKTRVRRWI